MRWLIGIIPVLIAALAACDADETREVARGFAVNELCDIRREPAVVGPDRNDSSWNDDFGLSGKAYQDRVELTWEPQEIPGLIGYRVARYSYDYQNRLDGDSIRTFEVYDGSTEFIDNDGLKPDREYRYRVFPVTTDGIDLPSRRLVIWTMPAELPPPPNKITANNNRYLRIEQSILAPVTGIRVLSRDGNSGRWRHLADKEYTRNRGFRSSWSWSPEEGDIDESNDYAVCLSNGYGYGKALLLNAGSRESVDPPTTPRPVRNIVAVPSWNGVELRWSPSTDPTVVGVLVTESIWTNDTTRLHRELVLTPNTTSHLASALESADHVHNLYRIRSINRYGITDDTDYFEVETEFGNLFGVLSVGSSNSAVWDSWSNQFKRVLVFVGINGRHPLDFEVVRKEQVAEGFRERPIVELCQWQYGEYEEDWWTCIIEDHDAVGGRWYVYEIRRQLGDGTWETDFHQLVTFVPFGLR